MTRTIVNIEHRDGVLQAKLMKADLAVADGRKPFPLQCSADSLPPLDSPANLRAYGDSIRKALENHPAISKVLDQIFLAPPGTPRVLCFEVESTEGDQIRWEVLCDTNGKFVAVDGRCQVGRIAEDVATREARVRPFVPPLRIALFLSAAGVDATAEWNGFISAFDTARAAGLELEARVYVGQQELFDDITNEVTAGAHPGITVGTMPTNDTKLQQLLEQWPPHIVHFFCHGSAGFGTGVLELATINEHALAQPGSVTVNIDNLAESQGLRDSWLVVLNCCEGGQTVDRLHSMAYRVVARGGIPAAIGMQEPVNVDDANAFSESLYPEIFRALSAAVQAVAGAAPLSVNLTATIGPARRALLERHKLTPSNSSRWTLPVLYVHDQPLQVHRALTPVTAAGAGVPAAAAAAVDDLRERAEQVASFLRAMPPDTPQALRDAALAMLDKPPAVPLALRPDRLGQFT